jgi:hypothetical protein
VTQAELKAAIETAFADTPAPGDNFEDISATQWDEGIVDYFRGTTWRGHAVRDLRCHAAALSFFTDKAFRYWLPAFMLAELEDPEGEADIIAESIAYKFLPSEFGRPDARLEQFSAAELEAIAAFLMHCAHSYSQPGISEPHYSEAAEAVRARLVALTSQ